MEPWQRAAMVLLGFSSGVWSGSPAQSGQSVAEGLRVAVSTHAASVIADDTAAPASAEAALHAMVTEADIVFTGEVTAVEQHEGYVAVRFLVEDGVRGAVSGSTYDLREWSGLWTDDAARYAVGQRRLMLLHAPSPAGFASPVSGSEGAIPLQGDAVTGSVDLRWVATHVAVADAARLRPSQALAREAGSPAAASARMAREALLSVPGARLAAMAMETTNNPSQPDTDNVSYQHVDSAMVMGMLHAWERTAVAP